MVLTYLHFRILEFPLIWVVWKQNQPQPTGWVFYFSFLLWTEHHRPTNKKCHFIMDYQRLTIVNHHYIQSNGYLWIYRTPFLDNTKKNNSPQQQGLILLLLFFWWQKCFCFAPEELHGHREEYQKKVWPPGVSRLGVSTLFENPLYMVFIWENCL